MKKKWNLLLCVIITLYFIVCQVLFVANAPMRVDALASHSESAFNTFIEPFEYSLRAKFYTTYYSSSKERKHNIRLASSAINDHFLESGEEFSFNDVVGERTEKNGYKNAKIISFGKFVDGVGGGVCQVSTTLYNAVLLAGLTVTESHPHSLAVSYVSPSFDAMVSYNLADLKFVNNTHFPIIIKSEANDYMLTISIYGQKMEERYARQSTVTGELPAPPEETVFDEENLYPELKEGEQKIVSYSKKGLTSEGSLIKIVNGKAVSIKKIRKDVYRGAKGLIVIKPSEEKINNSLKTNKE